MQRKTKGLMLAGCAIALGAWCLVTLRPGGDAAPAGRPGEGGVGASASTSAS